VAISEGRFVDLLEVDAASRTKVEDTRELLDNVQYLPTSGRYKVYLIDEVHMLSNHSFNALLKTLEEPPPHVKFLLATTDPHKLPVTILSRCLQFNLKNLNPERIVGHLQHVLTAEQLPFEEPALWILGRAADGSMRDALSLTDQAIAHGGGTVTEVDVKAMLGTIDLSAVADICQAIAGGDSTQALALVNKLAEHSPDYSEALAEMLSLWHRVAIAQTAPDALDHSHSDHKVVLALAESVSREDIQLFYQMTLLGRRDLPYAADARSGFEMVVLRLLAFKPMTTEFSERPPGSVSAATPRASQEEISPAKKSEPEPPPSGQLRSGSRLEAVSSASSQRQPQPRKEKPPLAEGVPRPHLQVVAKTDPQPLTTEPAVVSATSAVVVEEESAPQARVVAAQKIPLAAFDVDHWADVYEALPVGGLVQNTASNLVYTGCEGNILRFVMAQEHSSLYEDSHQQRLAQVLSDYFAAEVAVSIRVAEVEGETPRQRAQRLKAERLAQALASLRQDPNVNALIDTFGGELLEDTVKPIDEVP
jgi:DNA polymerase-3 subunit gamma/tau